MRHRTLINPIQTLVFSPDSSELAVRTSRRSLGVLVRETSSISMEGTGNVVRVWDRCAVCENAGALAALAARQSVRTLTPGERATFRRQVGAIAARAR